VLTARRVRLIVELAYGRAKKWYGDATAGKRLLLPVVIEEK
jgi:hypothetical protein